MYFIKKMASLLLIFMNSSSIMSMQRRVVTKIPKITSVGTRPLTNYTAPAEREAQANKNYRNFYNSTYFKQLAMLSAAGLTAGTLYNSYYPEQIDTSNQVLPDPILYIIHEDADPVMGRDIRMQRIKDHNDNLARNLFEKEYAEWNPSQNPQEAAFLEKMVEFVPQIAANLDQKKLAEDKEKLPTYHNNLAQHTAFKFVNRNNRYRPTDKEALMFDYYTWLFENNKNFQALNKSKDMNAIMNYFNSNHPSQQAWEKVRKNYRIYRAMSSSALDEGRDHRHFIDTRTHQMMHSSHWEADSNYRKILAELAAYQEGYLDSYGTLKSADLDELADLYFTIANKLEKRR